MSKLTDTHRTILATAGARDGILVLPLPKSIKLSVAKAEALLSALLKDDLIAERPVADGEAIWRTDEAKGKLTLVATAAGLKAVGIDVATEPLVSVGTKPPSTRAATKQLAKTAKDHRKPAVRKAPVEPAKVPKATTKLATLIATLRTKKGATIEDLTEVTGWQAHSVRGAISGALKKKLGLNIISTPIEGRGRVYRLAE